MTGSNTNQSCVVDIHTVAAFFPVPSPRVWKRSTELAGGSAGGLLGSSGTSRRKWQVDLQSEL
jgi:hypothetical protein